MRALIGSMEYCVDLWQIIRRQQRHLEHLGTLTLLLCLLFAACMVWKMAFYFAWQSGAQVQDGFPFIFNPDGFIKIAEIHPRLPFFAHGIAGTVAMISGAVQFLLIMRREKTHWHLIIGKTYAVSSIIASIMAIPLAWSLYYSTLLTSIAYTVGAFGWCFSTVFAVHSIRSGALKRHIIWIIRSYSCLAMVVTARILLTLGVFAGSNNWGYEIINSQYAIIIAATFLINLTIGEFVVVRVLRKS